MKTKKQFSFFSLLQKRGFVLIAGQTPKQAENLLASFAPVILKNEILVQETASAAVYTTEPMAWHQDSPEARWIAWYCINPGMQNNEPTELLDSKLILAKLASASKKTLSSVRVTVNSARGVKKSLPLLGKKPAIYWCPWLLSKKINKIQKQKLSHFEQTLIHHESQKIPIVWNAGDLLIIDNHRLLHRRNRLHAKSPRHLRRFWLGEK